MDSSWFTPTVLFCLLNLIIISLFINAFFSNKSHKTQLAQHDSVPQLNRSSSLLARLKSINFSMKYLDPFQPQTNEVGPEPEKKLSATEEEEAVKPVEQVVMPTTSGTVKGRNKNNKLSGRREAVVKTVSFKGDEQVDAKADDFINRFKQQLKMQRIDSIKRYTQMLTGGGSAAAARSSSTN